MTPPAFRYRRSDFLPLPVVLEHADVSLDFREGRVDGAIDLRLTARAALNTIELDARDLELRHVEWTDAHGTRRPATHDYQRARNRLVIQFPRPVLHGESLLLHLAATCVPTDHILEGIYKDATPPGCPQQYMSQCQQWGFQRILPIFDDCTAKCTFTTTIEADARYTHLISNGNIDRKLNPQGRPVPKPGDPSRQIIRFENPVPMAPYLFLVCVGTWDMLTDEVVYPSGKRVQLEYLVPPGSVAGAQVPMQILRESILWHGRTQDYEYPYDVYRTICMEKSNFGGMENVGNTTIITSAALIDAFTGDRRLEYAHGVILHEFEHNQCGSDVTMETPFDMWLNEGFTVDVERQFMRSQFDPDVLRIDEVDEMRAPIVGPLATEDGGHLGNIVREGFNDPDELVDGVTYVKSAEVIRMLRLIIGDDAFRRGKNLYFERYRGSNANTEQFFACFEEISGRDLAQFKREWLYTIGYPRVTFSQGYDQATRRLTLSCAQTRAGTGGLFHVPIAVAAVDSTGRDIPETVRVLELTGASLEVTIESTSPPAFVSWNRDCSFYGVCQQESATTETLVHQIEHDPNTFNRVEAMRRLTDIARIRLLQNPRTTVPEEWLAVYGDLVRDDTLAPGLKACLLRIDEQSLDRAYLPWYRERFAARATLMRTAAARLMPELVAAFHAVDTYAPAHAPKDGIDRRRLKGVLLRVICEAATPDVQKLAEAHFRRAWNISDRVNALHCVDASHHPGRRAIMEEAFNAWNHHLNGYSSYLMLVGASLHEEAFVRMVEEERRPIFQIAHPNHSRALFLPMASNNKLLWSKQGLQWMSDTVIRLARVNENTANRLVAALNQVQNLASDLKPLAVAALDRMAAEVDSKVAPSVAGRIQVYRAGVA